MNLNKIESIPLDQIKLDPNNPRLPRSLQNAGEKEIITWMLKDASLLDLIASIIENGFFPGEPIIVEDKKSERDHYIVIEGNRRVAASKIISDPDLGSFQKSTVAYLLSSAKLEENRPDEIPSFICKDRREVSEYLGFRHVTGVKPWSVLAKARFLYPMYIGMDHEDHETYRTLAKRIGSKASYVKRLMYGYEAFRIIEDNSYYGINHIKSKVKNDKFEISFLTDALFNPEIGSWLEFDKEEANPVKHINRAKLENLTFWLFQNKSKRGPDGGAKVKPGELQSLGSVLKNETARKAFTERNIPLEEALKLTDITDKNISILILEARDKLQTVQEALHDSKAPSGKDIEHLDEITKRASRIRATLQNIINENEASA
ncbi:MAG: ParB N-terminal domain-containing protein [Bacteroidota bacterium]